MAVYAIGDVQGCYDPLRKLLDAIGFEPKQDTLWFAGDIVNRGPKSLKTLRFVKSLGDSAITVLGNHDLHLLALHAGVVNRGSRFESLRNVLNASDADELCDWLRCQPLAHYDTSMDTLMVHAGTHPDWSIKKTLALAGEVSVHLRSDDYIPLLEKMYGNSPLRWSNKLRGYKRLRYIINCLTRMRMMTLNGKLSFRQSRYPWRNTSDQLPWFSVPDRRTEDHRIVFGHWSQLGLVVLPNIVCVDTGCVWGRQLTAVRIDRPATRIYQVSGNVD